MFKLAIARIKRPAQAVQLISFMKVLILFTDYSIRQIEQQREEIVQYLRGKILA